MRRIAILTAMTLSLVLGRGVVAESKNALPPDAIPDANTRVIPLDLPLSNPLIYSCQPNTDPNAFHWHYSFSAGVRCYLQRDRRTASGLLCSDPSLQLSDLIISKQDPNRCSCKESFSDLCERALGMINNNVNTLLQSENGVCYKCNPPWCVNWDAFKVPGTCKTKEHCGQDRKCALPVGAGVGVSNY